MAFTNEEITSFRSFQRSRNEPGDLANAPAQDLVAFMDEIVRNGSAGLATPPSQSYRDTQPMHPPKPRQRILVVEDNWLVAIQAKYMLESQGCEVIGPFGTVEDATTSVLYSELDGAILDINLGDETSLAVVEMLQERNIPFAFATGYEAAHLPDGFQPNVHIGKPYSAVILGGFLAGIECKRR